MQHETEGYYYANYVFHLPESPDGELYYASRFKNSILENLNFQILTNNVHFHLIFQEPAFGLYPCPRILSRTRILTVSSSFGQLGGNFV